MQSSDGMIQSIGAGLGVITLKPPKRGRFKGKRIQKRSPVYSAISRTSSLPSIDPGFSLKPLETVSSPMLSPQVPSDPLPAKLKVRTSFLRSPNSTFDLSINFSEMGPDEMKGLLTNALTMEKDLIESLNTRLDLLARALKRIQSSQNLSIQDISKLADVFQEISSSLSHTCIVESELGARHRELEKRNLEVSVLKRKIANQVSSFSQTQAENKLLKEKYKELHDKYTHLTKVNHTEKQKFATFNAKMEALEEGMQALTTSDVSQNMDAVTKLKGAIHALLRELHDEKSEVAGKNKHIVELNTQIQKLNKKVVRATLKLNEIRNRKSTLVEQPHMSQTEDGSQRKMWDARTLQYRLADLDGEQREFLNDLQEHGVQAINHLQDTSRLHLMECAADKLLELNDFIEQLHLLRPSLEAISKCQDTHSLILTVNNELSVIANAEHCHYWVFDRTNDEVWTLRQDREIRFRADTGLVGAVIRTGNYINSTEIEGLNQEPMEQSLGYRFQSVLVYPVTDSNQVIVGVLQIINNFVGKFDPDEEFLVETLLPVIAQTTVKAVSTSTAVKLNRMKEELLRAVPTLCQWKSEEGMIEEAEKWACQIFAVEKCRLLKLEGDFFLFYNNGSQCSIDRCMGICGHVSNSQVPEIVGDPYNDIRYNSIVDLPSSLPIYYIPVLSPSKEGKNTIAVLQIPHKSAVKARVNDRSVRVDSNVAQVVDYFVEILAMCLEGKGRKSG